MERCVRSPCNINRTFSIVRHNLYGLAFMTLPLSVRFASGQPCPVCHGTRTRGDFVKDGILYFSCSECKFRFSRPQENANFRANIGGFENAYIQYFGPDPADTANFKSLWSYMSNSASLEGASLLDIGAGSGKWVRYLASRGVDAHGVEPSDAVFDYFLKGDPRFFHGGLSDYRAKHSGRRFGLVTCLDVIEHVPDPGALLRGIADVLEPNGHAFLSCPDGSSLCARLLGRQWHHYNCYHYSFFSPQTLSRAADEAGLKIKHVFHPSRARAASYLARYFFEFLLRRSSPVMPQWLDGYSIWINLYDILCATLTMKT